jgi:hypothetical protein
MEVEGSIAYLNAHPEWAQHVKANIHLDMVGGGPETKAVFHVTRGPASVPSFINDVAESIAEFVNDQSYQFAATGQAEFPLVAQDGGKEPLRADLVPFSMGSDHQVYASSPWSIPTIYFNDWPDRNIHTNFDTSAMIDTTKLKRAAFLAAANAYVLSRTTAADAENLLATVRERSLVRIATTFRRGTQLTAEERSNLYRFSLWHEQVLLDSMNDFFAVSESSKASAREHVAGLGRLLGMPSLPAYPKANDRTRIFRRKSHPQGPMTGFGYDYFEDKYGKQRTAQIRLLKYRGLRGTGEEYAYEALNIVDGHRTEQQIRDDVSAIYGPVPLEFVAEYLRALESIGVLEPA